jgi:hypothetical protein
MRDLLQCAFAVLGTELGLVELGKALAFYRLRRIGLYLSLTTATLMPHVWPVIFQS